MQLVAELKASQATKARLEADLATIKPDGVGLEAVSIAKIRELLDDLVGTLEYATTEERREVMSMCVARIDVPQKGQSLLETNPEGLLSSVGCFSMVTPREVEHNANFIQNLQGFIHKIDMFSFGVASAKLY